VGSIDLLRLFSRLRNSPFGGGRTWSAHFAFTRINTTPTILRKKIEDLREIPETERREGGERVGFEAMPRRVHRRRTINLALLNLSELQTFEARSAARKSGTDYCCREC
jgi:hypothetical protein